MASPVNYEFVYKVPEDHQCTICTSILTDPIQNECCGQLFCDGCLKEWLQKQKTCPHCRETKFAFIKDKRMKRVIDSLKIYCPNRSKGCDKITTLGECNQHLEKCLFVEVSCTKKCGERMLRKELQDHEDNKCPNRRVQCQYCTLEGMHKEITAKSHLDKCVGFPVSCPNNCEHEIQRKNLADHQKVCSLEPVKCPFFEAGCRKMILRKHLAAHKASNTEHHLELVMTETVTLKHKATNLEQKADKFEQKATNLEQKANRFEQKANKFEQISLKFDGLASCVTKQLGTIDSNPRNTQAAIKNIKSSLETMTTMLAPDTRYYLPLVKESHYEARSASFYIKPGYKMYVSIDGFNTCMVHLEKGEHDRQLKWPLPEMEIELSTTENKILNTETICTRCCHTVNQLEEDTTQQDITHEYNHLFGAFCAIKSIPRNFVFLTVKEHFCIFD